MKSTISGPFRNTVYNLMRDVGYHFQYEDKKTKELSFARPRSGFPRFHLFIKTSGNDLSLSLHLDQKKPVYEGTTAHSGDYDEPVVQQEMTRIKQLIKNPIQY
jgi:hypothetical protein